MMRTLLICNALAIALIGSGVALADSAGTVAPNSFPHKAGQDLYAAICQGCHMPDGKGAVGAGSYPALADNSKLLSAGYPIYLVLYGQKEKACRASAAFSTTHR